MMAPESTLGDDRLGSLWRSDKPPVPPAREFVVLLEARARAGTRRQIFSFVIELLITAGAFGAVAWVLPPETVVPLPVWTLAIGHTLLIWGVVLWHRRGTWRTLDRDTESFLALSRRRVEARRRGARFAVALVGIEAAAGVLALLLRTDSPWRWLIGNWPLTLLCLAILVAVGVTARRTLRQADRDRLWLARLAVRIPQGSAPPEPSGAHPN